MNKLDNLERVIDSVEKGVQALDEAEQWWEEDVVSQEIETRFFETREELSEILGSLKDRMRELEELED